MKRLALFLVISLTILVIWKLSSSNQWRVIESNPSPTTISANSRINKEQKKSEILKRVRNIAQRRMPNVKFDGHEKTNFSEFNPVIEELDVMEILLAVEADFGIDIPEKAINAMVGYQNRRNLRGQLSLSQIAELVDAVVPSAVR